MAAGYVIRGFLGLEFRNSISGDSEGFLFLSEFFFFFFLFSPKGAAFTDKDICFRKWVKTKVGSYTFR